MLAAHASTCVRINERAFRLLDTAPLGERNYYSEISLSFALEAARGMPGGYVVVHSGSGSYGRRSMSGLLFDVTIRGAAYETYQVSMRR